MTYASQQDLIDRYSEAELIQRTAVDGGDEIDAATVAAALADADAEIDLHLRVRYRVPLALPAPTVIVKIACALARFTLWKDAVSEKVETDRDNAMALLRDLAAGKTALDIPNPADESSTVHFSADPPAIDAAALKSFIG